MCRLPQRCYRGFCHFQAFSCPRRNVCGRLGLLQKTGMNLIRVRNSEPHTAAGLPPAMYRVRPSDWSHLLSSGDLQDDLAELFAIFEAAVRLGGSFEWKDRINDRLQKAASDQFERRIELRFASHKRPQN